MRTSFLDERPDHSVFCIPIVYDIYCLSEKRRIYGHTSWSALTTLLSCGRRVWKKMSRMSSILSGNLAPILNVVS